MNFRIGCAVWAFQGWVGELFPPGSRSNEFLRLYSERFTTVEGNTTFYSVPDRATVRRWATETVPEFQFCPKLPKSLTHSGLLEPHLTETRRFVNLMQELGDRLGPLLIQLPPSYSPHHLADLETFLTSLPRENAEFALEVRHLDWFQPLHAQRLNDLLEELGIGRALLDTRPIYNTPEDPQFNSDRRKPKLPLQPTLTAPFSLIRFVAHPHLELNQSYMQEWMVRVKDWLQQNTRIYFFVHCPLEVRSPRTARHFQHLLEQHGAKVPLLPWDSLEQPPAQLDLF